MSVKLEIRRTKAGYIRYFADGVMFLRSYIIEPSTEQVVAAYSDFLEREQLIASRQEAKLNAHYKC